MKTIQMSLEEYTEDLQSAKIEALQLVPDLITTIESVLKLSRGGRSSDWNSAILKLYKLLRALKTVKAPGDF